MPSSPSTRDMQETREGRPFTTTLGMTAAIVKVQQELKGKSMASAARSLYRRAYEGARLAVTL